MLKFSNRFKLDLDMETGNYYIIRKMKDDDIQQVLDIDLDAFPTQWPHPTTSSYQHEMRNRLAHYLVIAEKGKTNIPAAEPKPTGIKALISSIRGLFSGNHLKGGLSFRYHDYLDGMAGIWMMVEEAHIVTIALRKSHTKLGLGELLLISIIEMASQLNAKIITLEVRVSNTVAQGLYTKYGFVPVGTRRRYYSDNGEDALIMSTDDISSEAFQYKLGRLKSEHHERWNNYYAYSQ
jgi:[ribosomal protein S18]-alanine N-acetyltransferase